MIEIMTGLPGMGKTLTATKRALTAIKKGKKVYANYPINHPEAEYVEDPLKLFGKVKNCLIIIDEMSIVLDALKLYEIPNYVWIELRQHRHDGVDILGTAQSINDVAYPVRRLIQFEYNIYFKMGRLRALYVRNPQPRGDTYGKRLMWISSKVFDMYDTHFKIKDSSAGSENKKEDTIIETRNYFEQLTDIQDNVSFNNSLKYLKGGIKI